MSLRSFLVRRSACDRRIDDEAAHWVARCDAGLTPEERNELRAWIFRDPRHGDALKRLESAWATLDRPRKTGQPEVHVQTLARNARRRGRRRLALSGGIAVLMLAGVLLQFDFSSGDPSLLASAESVSEPHSQRLPDGTLVQFGAGADIAVDFSPGQRLVRLISGEAHFQVAHDSSRPFLVSAGDVTVKAVGTAFAVRLDPQAVEVVVTEGRVTIEDGMVRPEVAPIEVIPAGNRVIIAIGEEAAPMNVTGLTNEQIDERLAWRRTRLELSGTPLAEAVAYFNARNRTQLSIADPAVAALKVSGVFRTDNLDGFVRLLEESFRLKADFWGADSIILERRR